MARWASRNKLEENEVVPELKRLKLWRGYGPRQDRRDAEGFSSGDLETFCARFRARADSAGNSLGPTEKELRDAAKRIRAGRDAFCSIQAMKVLNSPWFTIRTEDIVDSKELPAALTVLLNRKPVFIGDVDAAILDFAEDLTKLAKKVRSRERRKRAGLKVLFRREWARFATRRTKLPLHTIGGRLFAIVFDEEVKEDATYRKAYARNAKRYPEFFRVTKMHAKKH